MTDNPSNDFLAFDSRQFDRIRKLPRCSCCGEAIQQDKAVYYNDQWICEECEEEFWQEIREDFLESVI